ncbi:hypothetical protein MKW92_014609 [Papaver armeniacum]|nr:hypothetical protein MKW92_014609 [Papaver armeniacum]
MPQKKTFTTLTYLASIFFFYPGGKESSEKFIELEELFFLDEIIKEYGRHIYKSSV